ncbi:TonB-dependent receptor [Pelomonas sp. V22]|uniref:TonB-dependent receptor n=1 Tax=Pelomonas sp. V22 TaxID=2822139 RepID=UPI0024A8BE16|nr:TonB-dependent receptor [Pelomonas sp. V22]MDI4634657.1 TonB-dependent receptor [Pelomonas sp. V22]
MKPAHPHRLRHGRSLQRQPVAAACALLFISASSAQAQQAQPASTPAPEVKQIETVVVTGLRKSIETSVAQKRSSDSIIEVISAEDLGKLPDASIAESLARLPGLTGQRGPDGRVNVISIRGLSPEFSGVLLNGREMVSSNDSRAVEFDQFPSELAGSATVYKTPDASLVGLGLSGTVDIRTISPLSLSGRQMAVNLRGERNSNGTMVPGVTSATGKRFSFSYVDQFANKTIGLAVGFARLDSPSQTKQTELVEYGDYTPFGLPLSGNVASKVGTGQAMLPMFWTASTATKKNVRDGLMVVLEHKPNEDIHNQLDLYYSKFKTHEVGGKFAQSLFGNWSAGIAPALSGISTTQIGDNTYATKATTSQLVANIGNMDTRRTDDIVAVGWNTEAKLAAGWKGVADLSYSRDKRHERYTEAYGGPYNHTTKQWTYGAYNWNVPTNGDPQTFTPVQAGYLANPANLAFGDVAGMDWVPNEAWIGAIRHPEIKDEIKTIRLSLKHDLEGFFSNFTGGVNFTQRGKDVAKNEDRILMSKDAQGNYIRSIPSSVVRAPFDMSWAGIPQLLRVDVPALVASGTVSLEEGQFSKWVANNSNVKEKVSTAFAKLDIDTEFEGISMRGNVGAQVVHAQQSSEGWEYRGEDEKPDPKLLFKRTGGTHYNNFLPSLNLVFDFKNSWIARFGLATTIVRPNIVDMRAGTSTPTVLSDPAGTPHAGEWTTAYSGNPELKPWRAAGIDLSVEKYFGKRSYISMAAFRKNLLSYIYNQLTAVSTVGFPATPPAGVTPKAIGPTIQPRNGTGGKVEGLEFAAALEGSLLHPSLSGFGVVVSGSKLSSSIKDQNPDPTVSTSRDVPLNGLSGRSNSMTFYYEDHGISARVSQRYRSPFTATTRDIFLNNTTLQQAADKVIDLQLGYAFEEGAYKGLSVLLQVGNVGDKPTMNRKSAGANAPDTSQLLPNYIRYYGRTTLLGVNYKF